MYGVQVRIDGGERRGRGTKALELWMVAIAARFAAKDRASQQRLAPEGDQTLRVEVFWM